MQQVDVVYHYNPTSNRNRHRILPCDRLVVYHYNPTSNRNLEEAAEEDAEVVYHYNPTSNRNAQSTAFCAALLYIIIILHQTATSVGFFC